MARAAATPEGGETRALILEAALQAFAEKGFDGATTREIASRAGVNHGLIPYYFGDKTRLWQSAVDRAFSELEDRARDALDDPTLGDERERAGWLIRSYVRFVARHPEFVRIMHDEGKRKGPRMRWLVDRHVKPLYGRMSELMERVRARGRLPAAIPPVHLFYILAGAVGLFFHQSEECKRLTGVDPFSEEAVEQHARAVEQLLLGPGPR
jgi:AcrR family transcriptional regulator